MAINGIKIPVGEFLALGVGVGDARLHGAGKQVVERGDAGETSWAFEGFEEMTWFDVRDAMVGMKLEELLAGACTAQTAQHSELAVMDVGDVGAPVLARGLGIELKNIREKPRGKLSVNVLR